MNNKVFPFNMRMTPLFFYVKFKMSEKLCQFTVLALIMFWPTLDIVMIFPDIKTLKNKICTVLYISNVKTISLFLLLLSLYEIVC